MAPLIEVPSANSLRGVMLMTNSKLVETEPAIRWALRERDSRVGANARAAADCASLPFSFVQSPKT
jgi:hypothetical protein